MPVFGGGRPSSSSTAVKPGLQWRAVLLSPESLEWLSGLLAQLRGRAEHPLAMSARQLLVQLHPCAATSPPVWMILSSCKGSLGAWQLLTGSVTIWQLLLTQIMCLMSNGTVCAHSCISSAWHSEYRAGDRVHGVTFRGLPTNATPAQVLLCSVSGDIFPRADDEQARAQLGLQQQQQQQNQGGAEVRQAYLGALLGVVLPWVAPADRAMHTAAANSEAELLDACRSACLPAISSSESIRQYMSVASQDRHSY